MQTEKHAPEALTIEEVFTAARHYRVPVYQRAYAWTQVEIATLLADVRRARLRSEKPDTQGASSDYYLGSLVVNRATTPEGVPIDEVVDGGDVVVGIGTYSGTYKRTGRFFAARVAHVWRVAGGEIVAFEQFTDTELVNRALRAPSTSTDTQPSS